MIAQGHIAGNMKPDLLIRPATPADAEALAALGAATFAETFGHLYPPEDLTTFLADAHGPERTAANLADPAKAHWIAEAGGEPVGYGQAGPCALPHPEVTPACGEIKRLYILRSWQGGGTGSRLLAEMIQWLGGRRIWLSVWSENLGAQRLYARAGFEKVGEYEFPVGRVRDREFIMARPAQG